jgi:membrane protein YqaA with SNARE-associated domain
MIALAYGWQKGLIASVLAALGAMLGGTLIYVWGQTDIASARAFFDLLPAIGHGTITRAGEDIAQPLFGLSILKGSVTGVPFKLYAAEAGAADLPLWMFLVLTPLVRLPRFFLAASLSALAGKVVRHASPRVTMMILFGFWVVFYAVYWLSAEW